MVGIAVDLQGHSSRRPGEVETETLAVTHHDLQLASRLGDACPQEPPKDLCLGVALERAPVPELERRAYSAGTGATTVGVAFQGTGEQRHGSEPSDQCIIDDSLDRGRAQRRAEVDERARNRRHRDSTERRHVLRRETSCPMNLDPVRAAKGTTCRHDDLYPVTGRVLALRELPDPGRAGGTESGVSPPLQTGGERLDLPWHLV